MNCQSCNTSVDYRYITNCPHCDFEVQRAGLPAIDPSSNLLCAEADKKPSVWKQRLANLAYVFVSSLVGMISGAVVVYFVGGMAYVALYSGVGTPSEACARGMAVGGLLIISGAYLGTVGGSVFAVKHPLRKGAAK